MKKMNKYCCSTCAFHYSPGICCPGWCSEHECETEPNMKCSEFILSDLV